MDMTVIILVFTGMTAAAFIAYKVSKSLKRADCGSSCGSCSKNCKK